MPIKPFPTGLCQPLARGLARAFGRQGGGGGKGQHPAPVTDFSGTPLSGAAPLTVQFTDLTTNAPQFWAWDFGDGETSTEQNPEHIYADADTYTVSLNAANESGFDIETKVDYIEATASSATWDPANKSAHASLSAGDLVYSTVVSSGFYANTRSTSTLTGKRALKATITFGAGAEVDFGIATAAWTMAETDYLGQGVNEWSLSPFGLLYGPPGTDLGLTVASGEAMFCYVDVDAGKGWVDNETNSTAIDRELGINPHFTFTPGTVFYAAISGYGNDTIASTGTLDPTYSSGTFAALNA